MDTQQIDPDPLLQPQADPDPSLNGQSQAQQTKKSSRSKGYVDAKANKPSRSEGYVDAKANANLAGQDPLLPEENFETPASIVAETDPLLGKVDAWVDEIEGLPEKVTVYDVAILCLAWIVFIVVTTFYFAVGLLMTVKYLMPRPFLAFAAVSFLIFLAFLFVAICYKRKWVRHMFMLCPLAAALGVVAGIGVLLRDGGLVHFYQDSRYYTNVYASEPANNFMDAGIFRFENGETVVDSNRHISYLDHSDGTRYCVAPVVDNKMENTDPINFWVVGQDCCDLKYYHCHAQEGYNQNLKNQIKTALVIPHATEISPISWLTWLVKGAGQHDSYFEAIRMAHARLGMESAENALLLRWSGEALQTVQAIRDNMWDNMYKLILAFAVITAFFAFRFVKHDTIPKKKWPKFNPRKALNRRTYHEGLADDV